MKRIFYDTIDLQTRRTYDDNGFLSIADNPIVKAGVFRYLGSEVGESDDNWYKVYRPADEIEASLQSFRNMPIMYEHHWVDGKPTDERQIGSVGSELYMDGIYGKADLITFTDKDAIAYLEDGSVTELSPGYTANFEKKSGTYNGENYDYIQRDILYNHLALVPEGRSGPDLRVLDKSRKGEVLKKNKFTIRRMIDAMLGKVVHDEENERRAAVAKAIEIANKDMDEEAKIDEMLEVLEPLTRIQVEDEDEEVAQKDAEAEQIAKEAQNKEQEQAKADNVPMQLKEAFNAFVEVFNEFLEQEAEEPAHTTPVADRKRMRAVRDKRLRDSKRRFRDEDATLPVSKKVSTIDELSSVGDFINEYLKGINDDIAGINDETLVTTISYLKEAANECKAVTKKELQEAESFEDAISNIVELLRSAQDEAGKIDEGKGDFDSLINGSLFKQIDDMLASIEGTYDMNHVIDSLRRLGNVHKNR